MGNVGLLSTGENASINVLRRGAQLYARTQVHPVIQQRRQFNPHL
jgi:hypothetical protein